MNHSIPGVSGKTLDMLKGIAAEIKDMATGRWRYNGTESTMAEDTNKDP